MRKTLLAASVEACFSPYRSALSLHAAWRMAWKGGDTEVARWQMILPSIWGRFA